MRVPRLTDINRPYTTAAKTNVAETFRKLGFEPPSEDKRYHEKWSKYRNANAIHERIAK